MRVYFSNIICQNKFSRNINTIQQFEIGSLNFGLALVYFNRYIDYSSCDNKQSSIGRSILKFKAKIFKFHVNARLKNIWSV